MYKKRSIYNISFGIISQVLSIVLGIVIPRLFLTSFGSEMNGFLNSVTQIFAYFSLMEAGVGAATLQALYKPVGSDDKDSISSILAATNHYYKKTGRLYLLAVIVIAIGYPLVISSEISKLTMMIIILFNGIPGVVSYYYQGKYLLLLQAEGKNYINIAFTSISSTLISITKLIMILLGFDILWIQLSYLIINLLKVVIIGTYIKKKYKWIDLGQSPDYKAIGQKNAAFVNQICDLIFRNTDTIILSVFCDLKVVSVYSMYTLLFSMIRTAMDYVAQGFAFIMGQTFNRDIERFKVINDFYETYRMALTFSLYNIAFIFILPFMKLYTAGINDINYIDYKLVVLFISFYLLTGMRVCEAEMINYAQHFKLTQSRCILEAVINLSVSIVMVNVWGIYGVLIGTIVALLYRANDMIIYANRRILNRGPWVTYRKCISNVVVFILVSFVFSFVRWRLDSYSAIIGWAFVSGVIICPVYFIIASVVDRQSFRVLVKYLRPKICKTLQYNIKGKRDEENK